MCPVWAASATTLKSRRSPPRSIGSTTRLEGRGPPGRNKVPGGCGANVAVVIFRCRRDCQGRGADQVKPRGSPASNKVNPGVHVVATGRPRVRHRSDGQPTAGTDGSRAGTLPSAGDDASWTRMGPNPQGKPL